MALAVSAKPLPREYTLQWDASSVRSVAAPGAYARVIRLESGDLLCCYQSGGRSRVMRSRDNGHSWAKPVTAAEIPVGAAANPELLQLRNGDLMLMINERPGNGVHPYAISVCFSRNEGRRWGPLRRLYEAGVEFENGCWEPAALQFPDGEIQIYFANEAPYRDSHEQEISMISSGDNGKTWSTPQTVAFRPRHRDGMPVPLQLRDRKTVVMAIEDNGPGKLQPFILRTTVSKRWGEGVIGAESPRREAAVELPPHVYAGAPYIAQMPNGLTLLSVQSDEFWSEERMVVYIGDDEARNFCSRSVPFELPDAVSGKWNSLLVKDDDTVLAVSSVMKDGIQQIWMVDGTLLKREQR